MAQTVQRFGGTGGAFTALADDGSGSVYGLVHGSYANLIQQGEDVSTVDFVFAFGARKEFVRLLEGRDVGQAGNPPTSVVEAQDGLSATPTVPLRAQLGAAFTSGPLTLAADVVYLGARDVHDDPGLAPQGLDRHIVRLPVFNGSVGFEYLDGNVPIRAGLFTDMSGSQSPADIGSGPVPTNSLHVDRYGATASVGLKTEHVTTNVGINASYGSGTEYLPQQLDFTNIQPTAATQLNAYLFLATSYEF